MKKQKRGRGRPVGSLGSGGVPSNYDFWKGLLKENKIQEFIDRGNQRQKDTIKHVLKYLKKQDSELFNEIKGNNLLKQLKG